nr:copper homeostasis protein CutC [Planctomycetota bacterium]
MTTAMPLRFELCVDSAPGALAAQEGGADRIELCADLIEGGITPSAGAVQFVREQLSIPVMVLVRPRGGDFVYSATELEVMRRDIEMLRAAGVDGVVVGALRRDGTLDLDATRVFVAAARPMQVTFHRAFDMCIDPFAALEQLVELGVDRVLTSGQVDSAGDGLERIKDLVRRAAGRLSVMPGGGIDETNIARIAAQSEAHEIHVAALASFDSEMEFRNPHCGMGCGTLPGEYERRETDVERVRTLLRLANG